jgi:hypothetical protein
MLTINRSMETRKASLCRSDQAKIKVQYYIGILLIKDNPLRSINHILYIIYLFKEKFDFCGTLFTVMQILSNEYDTWSLMIYKQRYKFMISVIINISSGYTVLLLSFSRSTWLFFTSSTYRFFIFDQNNLISFRHFIKPKKLQSPS